MLKGLPYLLILFSLPSIAQIKFQKVFGESTTAIAYSSEPTIDSGYILAGWSGSGIEDYCLVKTDINGDVSWTKSYNSGADDVVRSVIQTTDSGYLMCGRAWFNFPFIHIYVYLVKTNALGDTLWTKFYYLGGGEFGYSVRQTSDGGYIIAGELLDTITNYTDAYLIKTDSMGNLLWSRGYGGTDDDVALNVIQINNQFAFIGTTTYLGISYPYFIKTDSTGIPIIIQRYNNPGSIYSFCQTSDRGFIMAGSANGAQLIKIDSTGNINWSKSYGGSGMDIAYSVSQTYDNGYIFSGVTTSYGDSWGDFYLVRCDSNGNVMWSKTYGGINEDYAYCVAQAKDSGFIAAGITNGLGASFTDLYFIKTDSFGNTDCNEDTAATIVSSVNVQAINTNMSSYIPGTVVSNTNTNIIVRGHDVTLCSTLNTYDINPQTISVFPNPFHTEASFINYNEEFENTNYEIRIYNSIGKLVRIEKISNLNSYTLHRDGLLDGLYYFQLSTLNFQLIGSGKFIAE